MVIFSGGLQRATHSDRYCITVSKGEKIVVFDFTSKIVDFFTVSPKEGKGPFVFILCVPWFLFISLFSFLLWNTYWSYKFFVLPDETGPEALIVLAEEEIVAVDLQGDDWLQINLPYLVSVHASSVTCSQYVSDVSPELWEKIETCGQKQMEGQFSQKVQ